MGELRQKFEAWFKTTTAHRMLESMNYYKMDLFHFVDGRGEYRHTSVQMAFMTWVEQQTKIEQLEKQQRINSECINNLVKQKADYLHKVIMAIAHLDSFDHSRAGMNQLVRSIESALEALRGES